MKRFTWGGHAIFLTVVSGLFTFLLVTGLANMVRNPISMILPLLLLALTYIMTYFTLVDHPKRLWISSLFYFAWALCVFSSADCRSRSSHFSSRRLRRVLLEYSNASRERAVDHPAIAAVRVKRHSTSRSGRAISAWLYEPSPCRLEIRKWASFLPLFNVAPPHALFD